MKTIDIRKILEKANLSEDEINSFFSALEEKLNITEDGLTEQINSMIPDNLSGFEGPIMSLLPKLDKNPTATSIEKEIAERLGVDEDIIAKLTLYGETTLEKADSMVDTINALPFVDDIPLDVSEVTSGFSSREDIGNMLNEYLSENIVENIRETNESESELTSEQREELKNRIQELFGRVKDFLGDRVEDVKNEIENLKEKLSDLKERFFPDNNSKEEEREDNKLRNIFDEYRTEKGLMQEFPYIDREHNIALRTTEKGFDVIEFKGLFPSSADGRNPICSIECNGNDMTEFRNSFKEEMNMILKDGNHSEIRSAVETAALTSGIDISSINDAKNSDKDIPSLKHYFISVFRGDEYNSHLVPSDELNSEHTHGTEYNLPDLGSEFNDTGNDFDGPDFDD